MEVISENSDSLTIGIPSMNCADRFCVYNVPGTDGLQINLTSIASLSYEADRIKYHLQLCKTSVPSICGEKGSCIINDIKNKTQILSDNYNWALEHSVIDKGLQLYYRYSSKYRFYFIYLT